MTELARHEKRWPESFSLVWTSTPRSGNELVLLGREKEKNIEALMLGNDGVCAQSTTEGRPPVPQVFTLTDPSSAETVIHVHHGSRWERR